MYYFYLYFTVTQSAATPKRIEVYFTNYLGITLTARVGLQAWKTLNSTQGDMFIVTPSAGLQIRPMSDVSQETILETGVGDEVERFEYLNTEEIISIPYSKISPYGTTVELGLNYIY